jgi:hypothetical protein
MPREFVHEDHDAVYVPLQQEVPVMVSVQVGDGQVGSYTVFVDGEPKSYNQPISVGTGAGMRDQKTMVITTVRDTLRETNWTSITIIVEEGEDVTVIGPYKREVPKQGDSCIYTISITHQ